VGPALALVSAILYGAADFIGGLTARRTTTTAAVLVSQSAGLALLLVLMPAMSPAVVTRSDVWWGVAAGIGGGVGVALLYRALAVGTMAVVAPITAVCAVAIPVAASAIAGERVSRLAAAGIALAIVAIVLVSQERAHQASDADRVAGRARAVPRGVGIALLSGVAIGLFYLTLARTGREAGMWPLVAARTTSVALFVVIASARRTTLRMSMAAATLAIAGGALDMGANGLYLLATRHGALSVTVTLASLYPASTIVLARILLGERLSIWQRVGIVCVLGAIVLIVGGIR
jgi:drug/metabolite transporter (DMT)-like permease